MKNGKVKKIIAWILIAALAVYGLIATLGFDRAKKQTAVLEEKIAELEERISTQQLELEEAKKYTAPTISFSSEETVQGDILSVKVNMNSEKGKAEPEISTDLGDPIFISDSEGSYVAFVPIWYAQNPGSYEINVTAGPVEKTKFIKVSKYSFGEQHMTMSSETAESTIGADNANADYNQKVKATFTVFDDQKYWSEPFIRPVDGRVSTEFGLYRYTTYTGGGSRTTRHTGIDLGVPEGTPVPASNTGRVIFAGEVIITGNTIVIEHGGGLRTYYFHLSEIDCKEGDMVERGQIIGKVGTTGYSTGAHLHFELKIGAYSLNPWPLFDGSSGIYK